MENEKLDKDKKLLRMFMNKHNYEKLYKNTYDLVKFYLERLSPSFTEGYRQMERVIFIKKKLEKYQEIIENKYCDGISKNRIAFLRRLFSILKREHYSGEVSGKKAKEVLLSFEDQEYLDELRGDFKVIADGEYQHDEEWINISVVVDEKDFKLEVN